MIEFSFNILGLSLIAIADGWGEMNNFLSIQDGSITVTAWDLRGFKENEIVKRKSLQEVETAKYMITEKLASGNLINVQVGHKINIGSEVSQFSRTSPNKCCWLLINE